MAHAPTSEDAAPPRRAPLRVRLDGRADRREHAAWALEALLARARVLDWQLVGHGEDADLVWGGTGGGATLELPSNDAAWEFRQDAAPDPDRDPLATAFWWLARVEELLAPDDAFDEHGRFRFDGSAASRLEDPMSAPVDDLAEQVLAPLEAWRVERAQGEPTWRLVCTHDIDLPWRWTRVGRRRALRRLRDDLRAGRIGSVLRVLGALAAMPVWRLLGRDPWSNAARIARLERRASARSTSYLLAGRTVEEDGDVELHERAAAYHAALVTNDADGDQLGLHGSYMASVKTGLLASELDTLNTRAGRELVDHRFHYLRHRPVYAWPLLDQLGIRTDASLGFAETPGFRAGTAHPFRAWDHEAECPLDLVVIPLAVMDASYDPRYLDVGRAERRRHVQSVLDVVLWHDGAASLLTHNDRLCNVDSGGWTRQYRDILHMVRRTGGVACTAAAAGDAYRALLPPHRTT
jgi:hypothetical protein